jgi:hypothetical protein
VTKTVLCRYFFIFVAIVLIFPPNPAGAEKEVNLEGTIKLFSSVYGQDDEEDSFAPHKAGDYAFSRGELQIRVNGYASDNVSFRSQVDFIYLVRPEYDDLSDIESETGFSSGLQEVDVNLKEASFKIIDFILEGMDLTVGRQRARWGTSDEYNVIDNLNPVDYANLFSFDPDYYVAHLPMDGINLEYLLPTDFELKLQAVYFLSFKPSTLPSGFEAQSEYVQRVALDQLTDQFGLPPGVARTVLDDDIENRLDSGPWGLRIGSNIFNFDVGLSYYHGFISLPLPDKVETRLTDEVPSITTSYDYPRLGVAGFDIAGEIFTIGVWGEVGVYFPEDRSVALISDVSPDEEVKLLDSPYTKYTAGFDYTFGVGTGLYWNSQYNHGFYDEFDYDSEAEETLGLGRADFMGKLEDYYITSFEYSFMNDEIVTTLDFMLEVADYDDFSDNYAWLFSPQIEYKPYDGISLLLGYAVIDGAEDTKYGASSKGDVAFMLLKAEF